MLRAPARLGRKHIDDLFLASQDRLDRRQVDVLVRFPVRLGVVELQVVVEVERSLGETGERGTIESSNPNSDRGRPKLTSFYRLLVRLLAAGLYFFRLDTNGVFIGRNTAASQASVDLSKFSAAESICEE